MVIVSVPNGWIPLTSLSSMSICRSVPGLTSGIDGMVKPGGFHNHPCGRCGENRPRAPTRALDVADPASTDQRRERHRDRVDRIRSGRPIDVARQLIGCRWSVMSRNPRRWPSKTPEAVPWMYLGSTLGFGTVGDILWRDSSAFTRRRSLVSPSRTNATLTHPWQIQRCSEDLSIIPAGLRPCS